MVTFQYVLFDFFQVCPAVCIFLIIEIKIDGGGDIVPKSENGNYPTDFFRCSAWSKLAEVIESYCSKGTKLMVIGRLKNNNYEIWFILNTCILLYAFPFLRIC